MNIQAIKGVKDILPGEVEVWQYIENKARSVFETYGFSEIRAPIFEYTELFSRSIGETTDIVEKEMYTFEESAGKKVTLRPEGTAPVVRAYIEHQLYNKAHITKLYYFGPMFRHERPQAGRYRQFYQIGAEVFGIDSPILDAEILSMLNNLMEAIDVKGLDLQINSLGCKDCRPKYKEALKQFLKDKLLLLCENCQRRMDRNPLRVLDCKGKTCKEAVADAPVILDYLCDGCKKHFDKVKETLKILNVSYTLNPRLVRGLDYYTKTTFELVSTNLGAQNAVAAGGRYDGLVEELGGPKTPGIGFAIGIERLASLMEKDNFKTNKPDVFIATLGDKAKDISVSLIDSLREKGIKAETDYEDASLKSQMRKADKLGARFVLIIGEDEIKKGSALLRDMEKKTQEDININNMLDILAAKIIRTIS
ncbi:MAG: histidine--tRNA ligase [Nitrospirota bacterium]